ncbi:MAG: helix-turn-helix domain-containing protein [Gemmataceae bacterium]|nr:helix-turn-helix domain-containing protein [Gemmataceae bacterium]
MPGATLGAGGKKRAKPPGRKAAEPKGTTELGRKIIASLEKLVAAARKGGMAEVERQFTVRRVRNPFPRVPADPAAVAAVRAAVGASQAAFAALLGVSAGTVRAWEQGANPPSGMAARFLAEIRADPGYWKRKLAANAG